ncbi:DUF3618 domain-containing protein [Streptomyces spirodelae]|uniref:DUF3618 domain-containing protein n=1 Tax=Streptomyces spirodelae TaxID=2812904 RepID=A0ABS3WYM8_9ACTN|nr:DUF3618 domain-containing protein [Streptomyces spirodelae]MBO8187956.1 DUF3618 domain-containing protein [Streptomyces spirodelae]
MTHSTHTNGHGPAPGPEELRAQVEETRRELGETVEALAARADLKAQGRQKAAELRNRAQHAVETTRGNPAAAAVPAAAGCALLVVILFLARHRRHG